MNRTASNPWPWGSRSLSRRSSRYLGMHSLMKRAAGDAEGRRFWLATFFLLFPPAE